MYIIQQHTTKNGNPTNEWNLIKEATNETISRFTSGKMAIACLQELQTLLNQKQINDSESNQSSNPISSIQQTSESLDSASTDSDVASSELTRIDTNSNSSSSVKSAGTSPCDRLIEKRQQISIRESSGAQNQEPDSQLLRPLQESLTVTREGFHGIHKLVLDQARNQ